MSAAAPSKAGLKFGAEPKKLVILGVLLAVAAGLLISNLSSSDSGSPAPATTASHPAAAPATLTAPPAAHEQSARRRLNQKSSEKNALRMRTVTLEAQRGDIDPTLRLDLLARLKNVQLTGGERSLFEAGAAPAQAANAPPTKIMPGPLPSQAAPAAVTQPAGPPPVTIPLKFYGFSAPATAADPRAGFFLDGDNIIIANEGEVVKNRYRIVKLEPKSAEVQDMIGKVQQTLPLTPEGTE
ncbi:MAG TPA: hypothetical protein VN737_10780 [Bryobacteraceae bacterium]|jgi:hypothetical protein|nr:hypothetical protein [Bryobacteraceae bacterium]